MTTERGEGYTESFRRAERAMYALSDFFFRNLDTSVGCVAMRFCMPYARDPNRSLEGIMEKEAAKDGAS